MKKSTNIIIGSIVTIAVIALGCGLGAMIYIKGIVDHFDQVFAQGVSVENIGLGGMTKQEATEKLEQTLAKSLNNRYLTLSDGRAKCDVSLKDIQVAYDIQQTLQKAFQKGHEGGLLERYQIATQGLNQNEDFALNYIYTQEAIEKGLESCQGVFKIPVIEASIERKDRKFIITPEQKGYEMDCEATAKEVIASFEQNKLDEVVTVKMKVIEPVHTAESLKLIQTPISSFKTSYSNSDANRNTNLDVAAEKINRVLAPNEVFSLAESLEPISYQAGYRDASVIVSGKIEPGIGGGVCQIASTLYNAVLLSNLEVVYRQNHSLPVAYVPLGRDATYSTGSIDLKFKNNSQYPVFIESYCENNQVYVNIFGHESMKPKYSEIRFQSDTVETIPAPATQYIDDPSLEIGKEVQEVKALTGYKIKLYKLYYNNNKLVNKELVDQSYYRPRAAVIKRGTKVTTQNALPNTEQAPVQTNPNLSTINTPLQLDSLNTENMDLNSYNPSDETQENNITN